MQELRTRYKIMAEISASTVDASGLVERAAQAGIALSPGIRGNLEGIWTADDVCLGQVLTQLRDAGLGPFMIQRSAVSFTVSVSQQQACEARRLLHGDASGAISEMEDLFSGERILNCVVECERAGNTRNSLQSFQGAKVAATECFILMQESGQ